MGYQQYVEDVLRGTCQMLETYQIDLYVATLEQARFAFDRYLESRSHASLSLATDLYDHCFRRDFNENWLRFQVGMLQSLYRRNE